MAEILLAGLALPSLAIGGRAGWADLTALLAWLTWTAGAAGWLAGAAGARPWRALGFCASAWSAAAAVAVLAGPARQLDPSVARALCGLGPALGTAAIGLAWGARRPSWSAGGAAATLVAMTLASAIPGRADLIQRGWAQRDPALAERLLDASPTTLAVESAGIDWMRHPGVYEPAGTDWFSGRRQPYGPLAGGLALVVGCALALGSTGVRRAPRGPA